MIETTHRGYKIRYSENQDVWRCHEFDVEGETLSKCKDRLNKAIRDSAKGFEAIEIGYFGTRRITVNTPVDDKGTYWCNVEGHGRRKLPAKDIALLTPEVEAKLAEYARLDDEVKALIRRRDALLKGIERATSEEIDKRLMGKV